MNAITEDWLKEVGFKWTQLSRQPDKHWLLWLGDAVREGNNLTSYEDLGIQVAPCDKTAEKWFCWLRSDSGRMYSRFIHIRHLFSQDDLIEIIEGVTGQTWNPDNNLYGGMRRPDKAEALRKDWDRIDRKMLLDSPKWREIEKDDSRGGALPEHLEAYEKAGLKDRNDL